MNAAKLAANRFALSDRRRSIILGVLTLAAGFWAWVLLALLTAASGPPATGVDTSHVSSVETPLADQLKLARLYHADTEQALRDAQAELATASERFDAVQSEQSALADRSLAAEIGLSKIVANPARTSAEAAVAALVAERQRMLERLTTEHPAVVELDVRLASQQSQLHATPELVRAPAQERSRERAELALEQSRSAAEVAAAEHTLRMARLASDNAAAAEHTAARQEAEISSALAQVAAQSPNQPGATPQLAERRMPSGGWQFGCFLGLTIIGGGSALAWAGGALRSVFTSSEQIAIALGIPVLGVLDDGQIRVSLSQRLARAALRLAVLFSAASLALAAFVILSLVVTDPSAIAELASHPLDTLASALGQWNV